MNTAVSSVPPIGSLIPAAGLCVLAQACSPPPAPDADTGPQTTYEALIDIETDSQGFELPPVLEPESILPAEIVEDNYHEVVGEVRTNGLANRYRVKTDFGEFEIRGTGLLRERVHEVNVLGALKAYEVNNAQVYGLAAANAATNYGEGAAQLILHPVDTITGIPSGMYSYGARVVEMTGGQRGHYEDSYSEELLGISQAKREWAYRLGVDVYSANPFLQEMLNKYAWTSFAGGMSVRIPTMFVSGGVGAGLAVTGTADDMRRELRDDAPEDLRIKNKERLREMGVPEEMAGRFTGHAWYSPSRQTVLVKALAELEGVSNRSNFIRVAMRADDEDEAFFFTRMALLLSFYHNQVNPIIEVLAPNDLIMGYSANKTLFVPLLLDFGVWSREMSQFADAMEKSVPLDREISSRLIWVSGILSLKATQALQARQWNVDDRTAGKWLKLHDERLWEPRTGDPKRILPEIGS
jgi:hypothetical protein